MNEPTLTLVGNLAADPELRYTANGDGVANFRIGCTPSRFNAKTSEWEDGETYWQDCVIWRSKAEVVAETFHRGDRVIVLGHLKTSSWVGQDGTNRSKPELTVLECGPAVRSKITTAPKPRQATDNPWESTSGTKPAFSGPVTSDSPNF